MTFEETVLAVVVGIGVFKLGMFALAVLLGLLSGVWGWLLK